MEQTNLIKPFLELAKKSYKIFADFYGSNLPNPPSKKDELIISFFGRSLRLYLAIIHLSPVGIKEVDNILLRSQYELLVRSYWLFFKSTKRSKRFKLYREHGDIESYNLMVAKQNFTGHPDPHFKRKILNLKHRIQSLYRKYNITKFSQLKHNHSKKKYPQIKELSSEKYRISGKIQDFSSYYDTGIFYAYTSSSVHGGPFVDHSVFDYSDPKRGIKIRIAGSFDDIPVVLHTSNYFMILISDLFCKFYKLNDNWTAKLKKEWDDLYTKLQSKNTH